MNKSVGLGNQANHQLSLHVVPPCTKCLWDCKSHHALQALLSWCFVVDRSEMCVPVFWSLQEQQRKGVIVATDCNFSMAVAHHAVELKIPMFVIMPSCCSSPRLRLYRDYGAMVISYGSTGRDSQNHARHLAKENGYLYMEEWVPLMLTLTCDVEGFYHSDHSAWWSTVWMVKIIKPQSGTIISIGYYF